MSRRSTRDGGCLSGTTLLILITVAVLGLFFLAQIGSPLDVLRQPQAQTQRLGPAVVAQIRSVSRLETQSYFIDGVYKVGQEAGSAGNFLYEDVVVLGARAEIIAGIDLSKLREEDVRVVDNTVAITLPHSEILVFRMDERSTRVFDRQRGWLVGLGLVSSDPNLETQARRFAEQQLLQDACARQILVAAAEEGRRNIEQLLGALQFTQIQVYAPAGSCSAAAGRDQPGTTALPAATAAPAPLPPGSPTPSPSPTTLPSPTAAPTPTPGGLRGTVVVITPVP